jgi:hypothetical protein
VRERERNTHRGALREKRRKEGIATERQRQIYRNIYAHKTHTHIDRDRQTDRHTEREREDRRENCQTYQTLQVFSSRMMNKVM